MSLKFYLTFLFKFYETFNQNQVKAFNSLEFKLSYCEQLKIECPV